MSETALVFVIVACVAGVVGVTWAVVWMVVKALEILFRA